MSQHYTLTPLLIHCIETPAQTASALVDSSANLGCALRCALQCVTSEAPLDMQCCTSCKTDCIADELLLQRAPLAPVLWSVGVLLGLFVCFGMWTRRWGPEPVYALWKRCVGGGKAHEL